MAGLPRTGTANRSFFRVDNGVNNVGFLQQLMVFVRTKRTQLRSFAYANGHYGRRDECERSH